MRSPKELKEHYQQGVNITNMLKNDQGVDKNTRDIIEMAYDIQAGSYIDAMKNDEIANHKRIYAAEIAKTILSLCQPSTVLEAGVGEATTLSNVAVHFDKHVNFHGFDLSWSRVAFAKRWLADHQLQQVSLCCGDLFHIPFVDNAIDVVYTSHSIEPNGGKEESILKELYRVTNQYLVLLEPSYEFADDVAKQRMADHGYCRGLKEKSLALGYNVLRHEIFPLMVNPLNPIAVTIIEKHGQSALVDATYACPRYKTPLKQIGGAYYSPEALVAYPIIQHIPCLRIEHGIFASQYLELVTDEY